MSREFDDGGPIEHEWDLGSCSFTMAYNCVLLDHEIGSSEKILYFILLRYVFDEKVAWPGQARLALEFGCSVRQIKRLLASIKAYGLIKVIPPKKRKTNTYFFPRRDSVYTEDHIRFTAKIQPTDALRHRWGDGEGKNCSPDVEGTKMSPQRGQKCPHTEGTKMSPKEDVDIEEDVEKSGVAAITASDVSIPNGDEDVTTGNTDSKKKRQSLKEKQTGIPFRARSVRPIPVAEHAKTVNWPPRNGEQVYQCWAEEMRRKNPTFSTAQRGGRKNGKHGNDLLARFPVGSNGTTDTTLLEVLRVAIWDWDAIRSNFAWYTKGKAVPTLQEILYLADQLAAAVNTGFTAPPLHRTSAYYERWIKKDKHADAPLDPIGQRAATEGKTRAEILREIQEARLQRGKGVQ